MLTTGNVLKPQAQPEALYIEYFEDSAKASLKCQNLSLTQTRSASVQAGRRNHSAQSGKKGRFAKVSLSGET